jgi:hypothetical protein
MPLVTKQDFRIEVKSSEATLGVQVKNLPSSVRPAGLNPETYLLGLRHRATFSFYFHSERYCYAFLPSVKGVNPLTGGMATEELRSFGRGTLCPVDPEHGLLKKEGWCAKCSFHWPPTNFVHTSKGQTSLMGWRDGKDKIRKFVVAEKDFEDIAAHLQGGDSVSAAIGFRVFQGSPLGSAFCYASSTSSHWGSLTGGIGILNSGTSRGIPSNFLNTVTAGGFVYSSPTSHIVGEYPIGLQGNTGPSGCAGAVEASEVPIGASKELEHRTDEREVCLDEFSETADMQISILPVPYVYLERVLREKDAALASGSVYRPFQGIPLI